MLLLIIGSIKKSYNPRSFNQHPHRILGYTSLDNCKSFSIFIYSILNLLEAQTEEI